MSYIPTRQEFKECILHFYAESSSCTSEINKWNLNTSNSILKEFYLSRKTAIVSNVKYDSGELETNDLIQEIEDPSIETTSDVGHYIKLEHHIVYSSSYQVPVLYLRAFHDSGTPLSLQEIYEYVVPHSFQNAVISQADHPVLGSPFWYIHPCDTRKLMSTVQYQPLDYIKSWLSVYGSIVGCHISLDMFL